MAMEYHTLKWNGPVKGNETIKFWILPSLLNSVLGFSRVILIALLVFIVIDFKSLLKKSYKKIPPGIPIILILSLIPLVSNAAQSYTYPPEHILKDLRSRLLQKPECLPQCADISLVWGIRNVFGLVQIKLICSLATLFGRIKTKKPQTNPSTSVLVGFILIPLLNKLLKETAKSSYLSEQQLPLTSSAKALY